MEEATYIMAPIDQSFFVIVLENQGPSVGAGLLLDTHDVRDGPRTAESRDRDWASVLGLGVYSTSMPLLEHPWE